MPRKQIKTREEKVAENFFPLDTTNIKRTIEKSVKKQEIKDIEEVKQMKGKRTKKTATEKKYTPRKTQTKKEYTPAKITLKKGGYELVITEKPQAASKIAAALGKASLYSSGGKQYYEVQRNSKKIIVACAVGHLFTLSQKTSGSAFPVFDIGWVPNFLVRKKDFTKKYYDTILSLAKNAGEITIATDYDIEGEVIGYNVARFICGQKDANRMKFSTLTTNELNEAYEAKSPTINWGQAIAGETRHYLDWFYGINLSRALMDAIKSTGSFKVMSIGRVQGPTLNLIVQKEKQIQAFKPQTYWQVFIKVKNGHTLELRYIKDIFEKKELSKFDDLKGKTGEAETQKTEQNISPPTPFDLTTLQTEAYRLYGITPTQTLQTAQSLYLAGLISYPRTSSQKLPASIAYNEIKEKLAEKLKVTHLLKRKTPIEGKKSDPAHPSIYPTGNYQILSGNEEKIYNLIVKRFLSLFCEEAIIDNKKVTVKVDGLIFSTKGSAMRKKAWTEIYPYKLVEKEIPDMDGKVKITSVRTEEKETQPPKRYSPASIISELEKKNLGTKSTRASILETLYDRGYVKDKSIEATPLGMSLIETLEKHSKIIIDEALTRHFEKEMESIQSSKKGFQEKEDRIIEEAKEAIITISKQFEKNKSKIGKELMTATQEQREQERAENTLNKCPVCKEGDLAIIYSKKNRKQFIACNAYPKCKTTFSLPPNGAIKRIEKTCEQCGFPILMRLSKGKRPWEFCFNPKCEVNKKRLEEYKKRKEEEGEEES